MDKLAVTVIKDGDVVGHIPYRGLQDACPGSVVNGVGIRSSRLDTSVYLHVCKRRSVLYLSSPSVPTPIYY